MPSPYIVVGVDGSPGARSALLWAADEAQLRRTGLVVVHAADPTDASLVQRAGEPGMRALDDVAELLLHAQVAIASARQPAVPVTMLLSHARAADALIDQSHHADLIVVGTRGRGGITMSLLGSVSHRVAAHAHCPVAVVPEHAVLTTAGGSQPRIVVGVSASPAGRSALEFAFAEARYRGAVLQAIHAWTEPDLAPLLDIDVDHTIVQRLRKQAVRHLDAELTSMRSRNPDVSVETAVISAGPAEALLRASRGAHLVVVGCHHSDDRWSTRLGPVPAAILHRTACPVIVVGTSGRPARMTPPSSTTVNIA